MVFNQVKYGLDVLMVKHLILGKLTGLRLFIKKIISFYFQFGVNHINLNYTDQIEKHILFTKRLKKTNVIIINS